MHSANSPVNLEKQISNWLPRKYVSNYELCDDIIAWLLLATTENVRNLMKLFLSFFFLFLDTLA